MKGVMDVTATVVAGVVVLGARGDRASGRCPTCSGT